MLYPFASDLLKNIILPGFLASFKSQKSRLNHVYVINDFMKFSGKSFELCIKDDADSYNKHLYAHLHANGPEKITPGTYAGKISMLRGFSAYISDNRFVNGYSPIFSHIITAQIDEELEYTDMPLLEDMELLFESAKKSPMDLLLFTLIAKCGLSTSQICTLKMSDVVYDDRNIPYAIKLRNNSGFCLLYLTDDVVKILTAYTQLNHNEWMFINSRGNKMTPRTLQRLVKSYTDELSDKLFKKDITVQNIRHMAVKYMKAGGAADNEISECIGVSRPGRISSRYGRVARDEQENNNSVQYSILSINL